MKTLGARVLWARKMRKVTQDQLAADAGCTQGTIVQIESDNTKRSGYTGAIARSLDVNSEWLETGRGEPIDNSEDDNVELGLALRGTKVPLISYVAAGSAEVALLIEEEAEEMVATYRKVSKNAYALKVKGDSMTAPEGSRYSFPEGCRIIADPEQRGGLTDGIFVVAKIEGHDAVTFKQLKYDGDTPYLNPLNPTFPKIFDKFRVLAKVVEGLMPDLPV